MAGCQVLLQKNLPTLAIVTPVIEYVHTSELSSLWQVQRPAVTPDESAIKAEVAVVPVVVRYEKPRRAPASLRVAALQACARHVFYSAPSDIPGSNRVLGFFFTSRPRCLA